MCKVFMMAGINDATRPKAEALVKEMAKIISSYDEDGVGYAGITAEGKIFGEKWVDKNDAFQIHVNPPSDPLIAQMKADFGEAAKFKDEPRTEGVVYGRFGDLGNTNKTVAVILHARKKTIGDKSIENTHPFVQFADPEDVGDVDTALIHNGSIANHAELKKVTSTCDSEVILHEYIKNSLNWNAWGIEKLAKTLIGEYAVGVLTSQLYNDGSILPILDVFKSHKELFVAWIEELGTYAFCTSNHNLTTGAEKAGLTVKHMMEVQSGHYLRFDAVTGERCEDIVKFELSDRGYSYNARGVHNRHGTGVENACTFPQRSNVTPLNAGVTNDLEATIDDVKKLFEGNHQSLFNQEYMIPQGLTTEEKDCFEQLEKDQKTNHKALRLVASVLGQIAVGS